MQIIKPKIKERILIQHFWETIIKKNIEYK